MSRESRTISVLEGDWERWTRAAGERGIADRGRAYSVSEYIRRAVEAYDGLSGNAPQGRSTHRRQAGERGEAGAQGASGIPARDEAGTDRREPERRTPVATGTSGVPSSPVSPDALRRQPTDAADGEARQTSDGDEVLSDEQEARTNGGATALGRNRAAAGGESQPRRKADSGRHLAERPITSSAETGGAVKREAKDPNTGESDPAAPPYRLQDLMGTRGQELVGLRQPFTKEVQTRRKGSK